MEEKNNLGEELQNFFNRDSSQHPWYSWSQTRDKTVDEIENIKLNYRIKKTDVELYEGQTSMGVHNLQKLIGLAKKQGMDVIQASPDDSFDTPVVQIADFASYEFYFKREIGLFSKKGRPWIIDKGDYEHRGIKDIYTGFPRSSEKEDKNQEELFHKRHNTEHQCKLKKDGRVLRQYRRSINIRDSKYICQETDSDFLKQLFST